MATKELTGEVEALVGDLSSVHAPRGTERRCKGWHQEAALRMLCNNLDPEVAEDPTRLIVYGGSGRAARSHDALRAIVRTLLELENDETMLVQSGKPVAVFKTHPGAPRVLIANSLLVPRFATWDEFRRLEALGLTMFGQMTAGSWIYIGTQGILQGTFQTFAAAGERHWGSPDLAGRTILTAGLGGMGGAQPLAASLAGAASLNVEVDPHRIARRLETRYLDEVAADIDDAVARVRKAADEGVGLSIGLLGNAGEVFPELARRGVHFDLVTDQTSAHDMLNGYVPMGMPLEQAIALRESDPDSYQRRARETAVEHVKAMVAFQEAGSHVFDYGNNLRTEARDAGYEQAFAFPGFVPAYIRPLFAVGAGPFRWAALSGDPADIHRIDRALIDAFPDDALLQRWLAIAPEPDRLPGAARPHLLAGTGRPRQGRPDLQQPRPPRRGVRPDRDRPRPPGHRIRRLALPRDRGHEGRLRRHRRLADPERAAVDRVRRLLGVRPPRRRRRHRQLDPRRPRDRRRRQRGDGRAPFPRAHQRPRHRGRPPR